MLTRNQFNEFLTHIIKEEERQQKFDEALKEYAPSDFTGFYNPSLTTFLVELLADLMNDTNETISWWLWELPDKGRCEKDDDCTIWEKEPSTTKYILRTPDDLYDYLLINAISEPTKDHINLARKAQDNGVKYALCKIRSLKDTNTTTANPDWEERNALLDYISSKIENDYRLAANPTTSFDDDSICIITTAEEENNQ